ncbi:MAG TPA: DUF2190 family protein [Hyphomicrobiaceae bacterium]|nr:DUF2190 family protein [Hyphomicrobiaceae bacterium]
MQNYIAPGNVMEVTVASPAVPTSGVPCRFGSLCGVATLAEGEGGVSATTTTMVDFGGGIYDLSVTDTATGGIAVGAEIWFHDANPPLLNNVAASGYSFGVALEAVGDGLTATINVLHIPRHGLGTTPADGTVTTAKLVDDNVTVAKLSNTLATGFIPLDIGSLRIIAGDVIGNTSEGMLLDGNTDPSFQRVSTSADKALRVIWASSSSIECQFPPVPKPPDMDGAADATVHLLIGKDTNTDNAATVDVQVFDGVGDTECGAATAALASASLTEYSATVALADLGEHPGFLNVSLVPGTHTTDAIWLYAAWLEYARK